MSSSSELDSFSVHQSSCKQSVERETVSPSSTFWMPRASPSATSQASSSEIQSSSSKKGVNISFF
eukprot:810178-Amphidinium_carterae.1